MNRALSQKELKELYPKVMTQAALLEHISLDYEICGSYSESEGYYISISVNSNDKDVLGAFYDALKLAYAKEAENTVNRMLTSINESEKSRGSVS